MARNENGPGFSLKDELFNEEKVVYLADLLKTAESSFDAKGFTKSVMERLLSLELKERISYIADCLEEYLDQDFKVAAHHIVLSLPAPLDPTKTDDDFGDFIFAPLGEYVVRRGANQPHVSLALATLREITQRFSMEDAIRTFINEFPQETKETLKVWMVDENYHVRRLVSEGPRPLLPWSARLVHDYTWGLPFLDTLHADPTRYVVRSVANHLNDIAKSNPDVVVETLQRWQKEGKQKPGELDWLTKHALRTLVKQGYGGALELLGYRRNPNISVTPPAVAQTTVRVGEVIEFSFTITAKQEEPLMVDYVLQFMKANGTQKPKVHKLSAVTLTKGAQKEFSKKHLFKAGASTLTYYAGRHTIEIQINGQSYGSVDFTLET